VLATIAVAEFLYLRALRVLKRRGVEVPAGQKALWHLGISLWTVGLVSPIDGRGDHLLSAHMAQHLLIADLGAPLLLAGARYPVLMFLLPRPALVALARRRRLRNVFRKIRRPLVAIPIYIAILYGWHMAFMFEAALDNQAVHVLQHWSFVFGSALVWWAPLDPKRRRLHGELWKIGHILGARLAGMMLGMAFVIMRSPAYDAFGGAAREHGMSPLGDQQLAGGMMLSLDFLVMVFALCLFFWASARDADEAEAATRPVRV